MNEQRQYSGKPAGLEFGSFIYSSYPFNFQNIHEYCLKNTCGIEETLEQESERLIGSTGGETLQVPSGYAHSPELWLKSEIG